MRAGPDWSERILDKNALTRSQGNMGFRRCEFGLWEAVYTRNCLKNYLLVLQYETRNPERQCHHSDDNDHCCHSASLLSLRRSMLDNRRGSRCLPPQIKDVE